MAKINLFLSNFCSFNPPFHLNFLISLSSNLTLSNRNGIQYLKGITDWMDGYVSYPTNYFMTSGSKINYPPMLCRTINAANGVTSTTTFDKYDFKTGNVLEQTTTSGNGKTYKSVSVPAYEKYDEMGPSYDNFADPQNPGTRKNMLSQVANAVNYLGPISDNKVLSASVQTWNKNWIYRDETGNEESDMPVPVWRKQSTYNWKSDVNADGTYTSFTDFNFANLASNVSNWQKTSEITLYNHFSAPLESKDINGNYAATKMGSNESYVIAAASNASYTEFTYTGFEDKSENNYYGGGTRLLGTETSIAHTGVKGVSVTNGKACEYGLDGYTKDKDYVAMVWVKNVNGSINTAAALEIDFYASSQGYMINSQTVQLTLENAFMAGDWTLFTINLPKPDELASASSFIKVSCKSSNATTVYFDDFRVQPFLSSMSCFVYDNFTGQVTAILDNRHIAMKYVYDDAGRLKETYKEIDKGFVKTNEFKMNYKRKDTYWNYACSQPSVSLRTDGPWDEPNCYAKALISITSTDFKAFDETIYFSFDNSANVAQTSSISPNSSTSFQYEFSIPALWKGSKSVKFEGACGTKNVLITSPVQFNVLSDPHGDGLPSSANAGQIISVRCKMKNVGMVKHNGYVDFSLSTVQSGSNPICTARVESILDIGEEVQLVGQLDIPASATTGTYYLVMESCSGSQLFGENSIQILGTLPPLSFTVSIAKDPQCGSHYNLTANPSVTSNYYSYSWSGPSIVGSTNGKSVECNGDGTYHVSVTYTGSDHGGGSADAYFTVINGCPGPE